MVKNFKESILDPETNSDLFDTSLIYVQKIY